jgi:hypothetical protein
MPRQPQQQQGAQREAAAAGLQDALPRKTVRRLARDEKEQNAGKKLRQPHQSEVQRTMRQPIYLPGDGHGLHLRRSGRQNADTQVIAEVGVAETHAGGELGHA